VNTMVSRNKVKKIDYSGVKRRAKIKRIKTRRRRYKPTIKVKTKGEK